jgi:hypothetical protein
MAHATHWLAGTRQHGQPRAEAGDGPIALKAMMHSAQIAKAKTGANVSFMVSILLSRCGGSQRDTYQGWFKDGCDGPTTGMLLCLANRSSV